MGKELNSPLEMGLCFRALAHRVEHLCPRSRRVGPNGGCIDQGSEIEVGFGESFRQGWILPGGIANLQGESFDQGSE